MVDWLAAFFDVLAMVPVMAIAAAIVYAGYLAYRTRIERETIARMPPASDPAEALPRLREELRLRLGEARTTLERTRDTVRRGTKG